MSGSRGSGFTIIEVMLFLAISGFLVIGIMAGAGVAINVQRYKDATNSFVNYIQGQYDRVANVQNNHDPGQECTDSGIATVATNVTIGASLDCAIIGRLLTVSDGGTKITSQPVYTAKDKDTSIRTGDDITSLGLAALFTDAAVEVEDSYTPEWSTHIVLPKPNNATAMDGWRLLIVRSPSTGTIRTFTTTNPMTTTPSAMVADANRADVTACIHPDGLSAIPLSGVKIIKDASGMSGVKMTNQGEC